MHPVGPVDGARYVSPLMSLRPPTGTGATPVDRPVDEVELSPEAVMALEAARAEEEPTRGLEPQQVIALQVVEEAMDATRRILAGLGLIPQP